MFSNNPPAKGTIGFDAAIDRPDRSRAKTCRSAKHPTRLAAINACLENIMRNNVRLKPSDTITTHEWEATGDGGWQVEMMKIIDRAETVTVERARLMQAEADGVLVLS